MRLPSWSRLVPLVLLLAIAAASVVLHAWGCCFSIWQDYDDQGYFMLAARHVLDGHAPYDEVPFLHGPMYFLWRWLLHSVAGIPLTFDCVRMITVGVWFTVVACGAAWVWQRSSRWSRLACALAASWIGTELLDGLAYEPGHSQEPILLVCACIFATAPRQMRGNAGRAAIALGLCAGALIAIKVNVGLLFAVGVLGHLISRIEHRGGLRWLHAAWLVSMMALPVVALRVNLDQPWAFNTCAATALSLIAMSLSTRPAAAPTSVRTLAIFALATIAGIAIAVSFALLRGSSVGEIVRFAVLDPLRLPRIFGPFPGFSPGASVVAAISLTLVVVLRLLPERAARVTTNWTSCAARLALLAAWLGRTTPGPITLVSFGPPLLPLALLPLGSPRERIDPSRHLLGWIAASAALQTYPTPGTQCAVASFPTVLLMIVLIAEMVEKVLHAERSLARGRVAMGVCLLASAFFAVPAMRVSWDVFHNGWHKNPWRVDLPGARLLVMNPGPLLRYRWMARNLEALSSRFVAAMSTNCLHFWTTREPLTFDVVTHIWQLVPHERQRLIIAALERERAPLVATHEGLLGEPTQREEPFVVYLRERYRLLAQFDGFQLLVRRETPPVELLDCAWWPPPDEFARLPARVRAEITPKRKVLVLATPREIAGRKIAAVRCTDLFAGSSTLGTDIASGDGTLRLFDDQGRMLLGDTNEPAVLSPRVYLSLPRVRAPRGAPPIAQVEFYEPGVGVPFCRMPIVDRPWPRRPSPGAPR